MQNVSDSPAGVKSDAAQIADLHALVADRRPVCPVTYGEIKACGPAALREYAAILIARANAMYGGRP